MGKPDRSSVRLNHMRRIASVVLVTALVASGCGSSTAGSTTVLDPTTTTRTAAGDGGTTVPATTTTPPSGPVLVGSGMVLDKAGVGPQLCSGGLDSRPPQCQGLPVVGLDWGDIPWAETAGDTTWADAQLVGVFNGRELVLTERPAEVDPNAWLSRPRDFSPPCPTPAGGWLVREPRRVGEGDFERARRYAEAEEGFAGMWVFWLQYPPQGQEIGPARYVATFTFVDRLDEHRSSIEELYGGPVCVSEGARPLAELRDIQRRVFDVIFSPQAEAAGIYAGYGASAGIDQPEGIVDASVMAVVGNEAQAWLDDEFGPDTVVLHSFLQPYEPLP